MTLADQFAHPAVRRDSQVEVRSNLDAGWHRGFEIAKVLVGEDGIAGYQVRRLSDRTVLAHLVPTDDVRVAAPALADGARWRARPTVSVGPFAPLCRDAWRRDPR
jgi:hypothetical protein